MIFLFPLVLSLVGAVFFFVTADAGLIAKLLVLLVAGAAAFMMFFAPGVPPIIPVGIQVVLCIFFVIYWQIDNLRT